MPETTETKTKTQTTATATATATNTAATPLKVPSPERQFKEIVEVAFAQYHGSTNMAWASVLATMQSKPELWQKLTESFLRSQFDSILHGMRINSRRQAGKIFRDKYDHQNPTDTGFSISEKYMLPGPNSVLLCNASLSDLEAAIVFASKSGRAFFAQVKFMGLVRDAWQHGNSVKEAVNNKDIAEAFAATSEEFADVPMFAPKKEEEVVQ